MAKTITLDLLVYRAAYRPKPRIYRMASARCWILDRMWEGVPEPKPASIPREVHSRHIVSIGLAHQEFIRGTSGTAEDMAAEWGES